MSEPFAVRIEALERELATDRARAVEGLRALQEAWACDGLGLPPATRERNLVAEVRALVEAGLDPARAREAEGRLAQAERWQWEIGTWATGSGEGLASMFEVRSLQLGRAWLVSACVAVEPDARSRARGLLEEVAHDPNDIAARHRAHIDALARRLADL